MTIKRLPPQEGRGLLRKLLLSYARSKPLTKLNDSVDYSMHWMRGQMVCYCQLREEVLLDRAITVSWQFVAEQMKNCRILQGQKCSLEEEGNHGLEDESRL